MRTGYGVYRLKEPMYLEWLLEKLQNPDVVRNIQVVYKDSLWRYGSIYDLYWACDNELIDAKVKSFTSYEHGVRFFCI